MAAISYPLQLKITKINTLASEAGNLPHSWNNVKTTITIILNRIMILSFDESEQQVNKIFGDLPITGVVL
jgi:hypothetical protein